MISEKSVSLRMSYSMLRIAKKFNRSFCIVDLNLDLINVNFEKDLSPEQLVTIKERYILSLLKNTRSQSPKIHNLIDMIIATAKYEIYIYTRKWGAPLPLAQML